MNNMLKKDSFCQCQYEIDNNLPRTKFCMVRCLNDRLRSKQEREAALTLPKMYIVKSTKEGIDKPIEKQVKEIIENNNRHVLFSYIFPYEIDIPTNETFVKIEGYGTGCGDLWGWTYYCTLSKEDANKYYEEELKRVTEEYLSGKPEQTYIPCGD